MKIATTKITTIIFLTLSIAGCKNTQIECMKHVDQEIERKLTRSESEIIEIALKDAPSTKSVVILDNPQQPRVRIERKYEEGSPYILILPEEKPYVVMVDVINHTILSASEKSGLAIARKALNSERLSLQKQCR